MPFWRDKLLQISYAPFTRVDIRRMNALGILDEPAVQRAYQDIGYDTARATLLTDFTLALNADEDPDDLSEVTELSRASVIGFYSDGVLDRDSAMELLIDMGYSTESALMYVTASELDAERQARKDIKALVIDKFKAGIISFQEAESEIMGLGLETVERDRVIIALVKAQAATYKMPSKADLDKMYKKELITDDIYLYSLSLHGYSPFWSDIYLKMLKEG